MAALTCINLDITMDLVEQYNDICLWFVVRILQVCHVFHIDLLKIVLVDALAQQLFHAKGSPSDVSSKATSNPEPIREGHHQ